jgi:hypothetical protein
MRKFLALVLAVFMMLSLCGCGRASQEQADALLESLKLTQQTLNSYAALRTDRAEDVFHVQTAEDFHWNGPSTVWFILPLNASPDDIVAADAMGAICQACGWTYEKRELGSKDGTPLALLKQALLDNSVGAMVFTQLSDYTADLVQAAADAGIIVLCLDENSSAAVAGSVVEDEAALGQATYGLIADWAAQSGLEVTEQEPKLAVAINAYEEPDGESTWFGALRQQLADSDTLYELDAEPLSASDDLFNSAYLWARSTMKDNPQTRIFCCYTPAAAYGVCYYLEQYAADQELDLADFCVVWVGQDEDSSTYLSVAQESSSYTAARGYVQAEDSPWITGARLAHQILGIAYGAQLPVSLEEAFAVLSENGLSIPSDFDGWQWGMDAVMGVTAYASFDTGEDFVHARDDRPLSDIMLAAQDGQTEEN